MPVPFVHARFCGLVGRTIYVELAPQNRRCHPRQDDGVLNGGQARPLTVNESGWKGCQTVVASKGSRNGDRRRFAVASDEPDSLLQRSIRPATAAGIEQFDGGVKLPQIGWIIEAIAFRHEFVA